MDKSGEFAREFARLMRAELTRVNGFWINDGGHAEECKLTRCRWCEDNGQLH